MDAEELRIDAVAVRELGLRSVEAPDILAATRRDGAVVLTEDSDFVDLVARLGPPSQIIWLTCAA